MNPNAQEKTDPITKGPRPNWQRHNGSTVTAAYFPFRVALFTPCCFRWCRQENDVDDLQQAAELGTFLCEQNAALEASLQSANDDIARLNAALADSEATNQSKDNHIKQLTERMRTLTEENRSHAATIDQLVREICCCASISNTASLRRVCGAQRQNVVDQAVLRKELDDGRLMLARAEDDRREVWARMEASNQFLAQLQQQLQMLQDQQRQQHQQQQQQSQLPRSTTVRRQTEPIAMPFLSPIARHGDIESTVYVPTPDSSQSFHSDGNAFAPQPSPFSVPPASASGCTSPFPDGASGSGSGSGDFDAVTAAKLRAELSQSRREARGLHKDVERLNGELEAAKGEVLRLRSCVARLESEVGE